MSNQGISGLRFFPAQKAHSESIIIIIDIYYTSKLNNNNSTSTSLHGVGSACGACSQGQRYAILACMLLRYLAWAPVVYAIQQRAGGSEVHVSCIPATVVTSPSHCLFSGQPSRVSSLVGGVGICALPLLPSGKWGVTFQH